MIGEKLARSLQRDTMENDEFVKLRKLVNLVLNGVSNRQIAEVFSLDESRIAQIKETDDYKQLYSQMIVQYAEQNTEMNASWDTVEQMALKNVLSTIQNNMDPEYALRAATLANRAQRRGTGRTLSVGQMGEKIALNLSLQFIQQIKNGVFNMGADARTVSQDSVSATINTMNGNIKKVDLLEPHHVVDMFTGKQHNDLFSEAERIGSLVDA